jgi:ankyrin repeat protein
VISSFAYNIEKLHTRRHYNEIGCKALIVPAEVGQKEIFRILLKILASVNAAHKNGKTTLILTAEKGGVVIFRELLTATTVEGVLLPLCSAATEGHTVVFRELLINGASVNIVKKPVLHFSRQQPQKDT